MTPTTPEPERGGQKPTEGKGGWLGDCLAEGVVEGCAGCIGGIAMLCLLILSGITLWASWIR